MLVAVVIPVFSPPQWITRLAQSCDCQDATIRLHLYVHTPASAVAWKCAALAKNRDVELHALGENRGLSRTWNDGMLQGYDEGADVVIVANDDIAFSAGDLDELARAAVAQRDRYIVSCSGLHGRLGRRMPSHGYSCFAINPVAIERLGCFDENFFPAYCEDQDYSRRASLAGLNEANCANTNVFHGGSTAIFSDTSVMKANAWTHVLNMSYYRTKWGGDGGQETYDHPFDDPSLDYRIPPEQRTWPYGPCHDRDDRPI
jgi:GT2 family glycosyltransferase